MVDIQETATDNIFKDRNVFSEDYLPEKILFRDEEIGKLNSYMLSALTGGAANNILVVGDYGSGKTATVRYTINKLKAQADAAGKKFEVYWANASSFVNQRKSVSCNRLLSKWLSECGVKTWPTMPIDLLIDRMMERTRKNDATIFIVDEIDNYLNGKDNDFNTFGYAISRTFHKSSAIMITNKYWVASHLQDKLDGRVTVTFTRNMRVIGFSDYLLEQLESILTERAKLGLKETAYNKELLSYIASVSNNQGFRARGLMQLAEWSGAKAVECQTDAIEKWMVDNVAKQKPIQEIENVIATLPKPLINILNVMIKKYDAGTRWVREAEMLEWFISKEKDLHLIGGVCKQTFWNAMSELRALDLIEHEKCGNGRARGTYGRVRIHPGALPFIKDVLGDEDYYDEEAVTFDR